MIPRFKPDLGWEEICTLLRRNLGAVERFEKEFAKAFQAVDAVAFPYGRSAQWAFFKAMGVENAEIIMPAYTCSVVAHAVTLSGNIPKFIDITLDNYNMNLDSAEAAINEKTRAIIATHTFGYPQDLDRLETMVRQAEASYGHKIWLMQDCCHAFGAEWKGRMVGLSGDVAVYAFNISKIITSIFGGMLTFQDRELAKKVRKWRDQNFKTPTIGKSLSRRLYLVLVWIFFTESLYTIVWWLLNYTLILENISKQYHLDNKIHFPPDYLNKMLDVEAAVGLVQLKKYPRIVKQRRDFAKKYLNSLCKEKDWVFPPILPGATYSHFVVRVPNKKKVIKKFASLGIELGELIQYSIPELSAYKNNASSCPNAAYASQSLVNFTLCSNYG